jgi:sulfite exporter TauE/SafE/copper chaperone CopZ
MAQEQTYYIKGMHCAACEILIEKKLLEIPGMKSVDASTAKGEAVIEYDGEKPAIGKLNDIFRKDNYTFSEDRQPIAENTQQQNEILANSILFGFAIAMVIVAVFLLLDRLGISGLLSISSKSSVITFFGFGIIAGLSSCAALVGGIVLSMSKQWLQMYNKEQSTAKKLEPHLMFNVGRILSYGILGGVLGLIGSRLQISIGFTTTLVIVISFLMIGLGLQMLGVKWFQKFQFSMPRFITRSIANENNFKGKYMPFIMGAATFFLPCGFTITAQTIALLSGNALQGALIMGFFALGTAPILLLIGFSSVTFSKKPHLALTFSKVAGFLVLFFALYNIYNQILVLGLIH